MFSFLKKLFSSEPPVDFKELMRNGAIVLDVRSKGEYQGGHIRGSVNIPVNRLTENLSKLKKDKVIITCCASGSRSGVARKILKSNGYMQVHNAGPWTRLR
jgi:rhodanese-related sulfurtransferase